MDETEGAKDRGVVRPQDRETLILLGGARVVAKAVVIIIALLFDDGGVIRGEAHGRLDRRLGLGQPLGGVVEIVEIGKGVERTELRPCLGKLGIELDGRLQEGVRVHDRD